MWLLECKNQSFQALESEENYIRRLISEGNKSFEPISTIYSYNVWECKTGFKSPAIRISGFEMLLYIIQGEVDYCTGINSLPKRITSGDLFRVSAGKGISFSLDIKSKTRFVLIYLDPNISENINKPSDSLILYSHEIKTNLLNNAALRKYLNPGSKVSLSKNIDFSEIAYGSGDHIISPLKGSLTLIFVIEGELTIQGSSIQKSDFLILETENNLMINVLSDAIILTLSVPSKVNYKTYYSLNKNRNPSQGPG